MTKLVRQFPKEVELENQKAIVRIFNPYGHGEWYLLNADPSDTDYLICIAVLHEVEVGPVRLSELTNLRIGPHRLPLERDKFYTPENAAELFNRLNK